MALADRRHDVDHARRKILLGRILDLEAQALIGIKRGQIVEMDFVADLFGILEIDRVHLEKSEIALALLGASDHALDRIAGPQAESPDLRGGNINIVRPREIVRLGRAQETETVLQDFDDAFSDDLDLIGRLLLQNRE